MAWPPPVQKTDWDNTDVQQDLHPGAHNDIALTLEQDYTPQISANVTNIATNTADIAAHEAVYGPTGNIKATDPEIWTDNPNVPIRNAAGDVRSYAAGPIMPQVSYSTSPSTITNSFVGCGTMLSWDTTIWGEAYVLAQVAFVAQDLKPGERVYCRPRWRFDTGLWQSATEAYYGRAYNAFGPGLGTLRVQVSSLTVPIFVPAGTNLLDVQMEASTVDAGVQLSGNEFSVNAVPFLR